MTYRPDLTETFSLKDLLKPSSPDSVFFHHFPISSQWGLIIDSNPIEDLRLWQKRVQEIEGHYYHNFDFTLWGQKPLHLWQIHMPHRSGKSVFAMLFLRDQTAFAQVGPNLRKLKLKINKKASKKEKAKQLRPQRDEWRRQERQRNKRLPGR